MDIKALFEMIRSHHVTIDCEWSVKDVVYDDALDSIVIYLNEIKGVVIIDSDGAKTMVIDGDSLTIWATNHLGYEFTFYKKVNENELQALIGRS